MNHKRHIQKAKDNLSFLKKFFNSSFPQKDWLMVVLFYIALHWVDAFLDYTYGKKNITTHQQRKKLVDKHLFKLRKNYRKLEQFSREARYDKLATDIKWKNITKWYNIVEKDFIDLI